MAPLTSNSHWIYHFLKNYNFLPLWSQNFNLGYLSMLYEKSPKVTPNTDSHLIIMCLRLNCMKLHGYAIIQKKQNLEWIKIRANIAQSKFSTNWTYAEHKWRSTNGDESAYI